MFNWMALCVHCEAREVSEAVKLVNPELVEGWRRGELNSRPNSVPQKTLTCVFRPKSENVFDCVAYRIEQSGMPSAIV